MTKIDSEQARERPNLDDPRCRWCRRVLSMNVGRGRPRQFCSQACRQWDWVARQRAREVALSDEQLVLARSELNELHDALYVLSCAVDDVQSDLAGNDKPTAKELKALLHWVLDCAEPLRSLRLRP